MYPLVYTGPSLKTLIFQELLIVVPSIYFIVSFYLLKKECDCVLIFNNLALNCVHIIRILTTRGLISLLR